MKESNAPSLGRTPAQKFFDKWQGLIYLIPWIIGFVVFKAIPFGQSLYYSFTDMNFFNGIHEYGVMNYVTAFSDAKITKALITTFMLPCCDGGSRSPHSPAGCTPCRTGCRNVPSGRHCSRRR